MSEDEKAIWLRVVEIEQRAAGGMNERQQTQGMRCSIPYCRSQPERFCCRCVLPVCAKHGDYDEPLVFCVKCNAELKAEREQREATQV